MKEFNELADIYDSLTTLEDKQKLIPFYKKIIKDFNIKNCLDCACGTGWDLLILNELGIKTYGSDQSELMLKKAKEKLKNKNTVLKLEDFRSLSKSWDIYFDLIICMDNSINYMLTKEDYISALNSMYNQLKENGILIISNGINDKLLKYKPMFIPVKEMENSAFYFINEYLNNELIKMKILFVKKEEKMIRHHLFDSKINAVGIDKLKEYISEIQFEIVGFYGDFNFSKYIKYESEKIIALLQK